MINCHEFLAEFSDYLDGLLGGEARQELEVHLSQCRTCQVIYDSTKKTLKLVTESGAFELPQSAPEALVTKIMTKVRSAEGSEPEPGSEGPSEETTS